LIAVAVPNGGLTCERLLRITDAAVVAEITGRAGLVRGKALVFKKGRHAAILEVPKLPPKVSTD
jgi:hypothetical protein